MRERLAGELEAKLCRHFPLGLDLASDPGVIGRIDDDRDAFVVLGGRPNHGGATDVDVLDDLVERGATSHGFAKRVEVDDGQIDGGQTRLLHFAAMLFGGTTQKASVNSRV